MKKSIWEIYEKSDLKEKYRSNVGEGLNLRISVLDDAYGWEGGHFKNMNELVLTGESGVIYTGLSSDGKSVAARIVQEAFIANRLKSRTVEKVSYATLVERLDREILENPTH